MAADIELELPDDLHERLQIKAAPAGLSVSDYLLRLMNEMVEQPFLPMRSQVPPRASDNG